MPRGSRYNNKVAPQEGENASQTAIIMKCSRVNSKLIGMRHIVADIEINSYLGLKISPAAVRFTEEGSGVYVLEGGRVQFKNIDILYEDEDFVLCRIVEEHEENAGNPLLIFDEVIIEGVDLYDGKII